MGNTKSIINLLLVAQCHTNVTVTLNITHTLYSTVVCVGICTKTSKAIIS